METLRIGFLGAGVMATALIKGIIQSGLVTPDKMIASSRSPEKLSAIASLGIQSTNDNNEVVRFADVIIIATKPDGVKSCLESLANHDFEKKSFISIAAGTPISALESYLPQETKSMIRVMPNTPCLVGQCAAAFASGTKTTAEDKTICAAIFGSVGTISEVPEKLMDAVTGLSGSGPACECRIALLPSDPHSFHRCLHVH
jgi:pyrroline-5-carboxylate reductase